VAEPAVPSELRGGGFGAVLGRTLKGAVIGVIPLAGFYIAQQLGGLGWSVGVGCALSLIVFPFERKMTGSARWAWIGLSGVALGAVLALVTRDPKLFFLRVVIGDAAWGLAMLGSLIIGKPLIGVFASWVVAIPDEYKETQAYKRSFGVVTAVWAVVNLVRAGVRGWLLAKGTLEGFLAVQVLSGYPIFAVLLVFSIWYPRRAARRYITSLGVDPAVVDEVMRGAVEEAHDAQLASGAEE
jgi:hypothetical protein